MANLAPEIASETSDRALAPASPPTKPWLWMDVTTSWRARPGQMNGTLRVERSYAKALSELMAPQLQFCRYHRTRRCFLPVHTYPDLSGKPAAPSRGGSRVASPLRSLGRRLERTFRHCRRAIIGDLIGRIGIGAGMSAFGRNSCREVLLLAGENWAQYDFDVIARLRNERSIQVAALCQDLIPIECPQFFESNEFVARYRAYADFLIRDVDLVVAVSEFDEVGYLEVCPRSGGHKRAHRSRIARSRPCFREVGAATG